MTTLLFVHGWGFDPRVWNKMTPELGGYNHAFVNMGFIGEESIPDIPDGEDIIAIGHSLGALWLLNNNPERYKGYISICGFPRFWDSGSRTYTNLMIERLKSNPGAQMVDFFHNWNLDSMYSLTSMNFPKLIDGLNWLLEWDCRADVQKLDIPKLVLAARDDFIVPENMTEEVWSNVPNTSMIWTDEGGHMLPLTMPAWCGTHIKPFIEAL